MSPVGSTGHTHVHPHSYMHVEHACAHSQRLLRPPEPCVWWGDSAPKCTVTRAVSPPVGDMVPSIWDAMVFNHTRGARLPPMTEFPQGTRRGHVHSCARCGATSPHLLRPRSPPPPGRVRVEEKPGHSPWVPTEDPPGASAALLVAQLRAFVQVRTGEGTACCRSGQEADTNRLGQPSRLLAGGWAASLCQLGGLAEEPDSKLDQTCIS